MSDDEAAWTVACGWVRSSPSRWQSWIPAICQAGSVANSALTACDPCPAGQFCLGGPDAGQPCPAGAYCAAGSSGPSSCPRGRTTKDASAAAMADCSMCAPGYQPILSLGPCLPNSVTSGAYCLAAVAIIAAYLFVNRLLRGRARIDANRGESDDDRRLRLAVEAVRARLRLLPKDGFLVGSEGRSARWWLFCLGRSRRSHVILQRSHLEAAARLALREDVDPSVIDALAICLREWPILYRPGSLLWKSARDIYRGIPSQRSLGSMSEIREDWMSGESSPQYEALGQWLIEIALALLDPDDARASEHAFMLDGHDEADSERPWLSGSGRSRRIASLSLEHCNSQENKGHGSGRSRRIASLSLEHCNSQENKGHGCNADENPFCRMPTVLNPSTEPTAYNVRVVGGSNQSLPAIAIAGSRRQSQAGGSRHTPGSSRRRRFRETAEGRFRYFTGTVCKIRVWRDNGGALFTKLQRLYRLSWSTEFTMIRTILS